MRLHAFLQGPAELRGVLQRRLGVVGGGGGGGRGLAAALLVKLHVAVLLVAVAADAAVALRVEEGAGVAQRAPLELALAQLDGAAAHAQHEALAVVVQAVGARAQGGVDVGEGHARGHPLLAQGAGAGGVAGGLGRRVARNRGGVVLFEGVDAVVAVGGVLLCGVDTEGEVC